MNDKSLDPLLALSPCPCFFCGCAKVVTLHEDRYNIAVVCNVGHGGCGARGPYESSVTEAVKSWNTRAANARGDGTWLPAYRLQLEAQVAANKEAAVRSPQCADWSNGCAKGYEESLRYLDELTPPTPGSEVQS